MRVTRISHLMELTSTYVDDWNRLAAKNPFVGWTWISAWWKHYGTEHDLYVLVVEDNHENVIGFAPWFLETSRTRGRRVKFLGTGHVCTDYTKILARDQDVGRVTTAIALWLKSANGNEREDDDRWDFLSFDGIASTEPSIIRLREELQALGHVAEFEPTLHCWRAELHADWDSYVATLSKKSRRKVRAMRKKYIDVGRTEFNYAATMEEFTDYYKSFVDLHQKRRNSIGEEGCFASTEFAGFTRDVAGRYFQQGSLLMSQLKIDGQIAASSLGVLSEGIHYMYQTGFDTDLCHHNPGWLMNVSSILYGQANGIAAIDYLRGDEPYKAKLGAKPVEMVKFRIVANQTGARVRNKVWQMRTNIKQKGLPNLPFQWGDHSSGNETPS